MPAPPLPQLLRRGSIVTIVALLAALLTAWGAVSTPAGATPALRHYTAVGIDVEGGVNPVAAPDLAPGLYRDTYAAAGASLASGTAKYYRVRLRTGQTPYLTVTESARERPDVSDPVLRVEMTLAPVDRSVSGCQSTTSGSADNTGAGLDNATAVLSLGTVGGPDWNGCPVDAVYALHVTRSGAALAGVDLEMEIAYRAEPAFPTGAASTAAGPAKNVRAAVGGRRRPVIGGTGFGNAPTLPAGRYRDSFTSGERRYYRVHLQWGQRLAWTLTADQLPELPDYRGTTGSVVLTNPVRQELAQPPDASPNGSDLGATTGPLFGSTLVPLAWENRRSSDDDVAPYSMDGDYYLIVSTAFPGSTQQTSNVPYLLSVQVVGTPTAGPDYAIDGSAVPHTVTDRRPAAVAGVVAAVVIIMVVVGLLVRRRRLAGIR